MAELVELTAEIERGEELHRPLVEPNFGEPLHHRGAELEVVRRGLATRFPLGLPLAPMSLLRLLLGYARAAVAGRAAIRFASPALPRAPPAGRSGARA